MAASESQVLDRWENDTDDSTEMLETGEKVKPNHSLDNQDSRNLKLYWTSQKRAPSLTYFI